MKDKEFILAFDVGSTGLKAVLFNFKGQVVTSQYCTYMTYYPGPTSIEQEPGQWWDAVCTTSKAILKETGITPDSIKAVAPVGHQIMSVPVDREGRLLTQRVLYTFDGRSGKQARQLIDRLGGYDRFYRIHGLAHPVEILSCCKAMWIRDNMPDVFHNTYKFLQSKGFIILNLTDRQVFVDDYGDASNTGWLDINQRKYSQEIADAAGVPMDKLPQIRYSHEIAGVIGNIAAEKTGLKAGTPVFTGTGDVPASCLGAGVVESQMHYTSIGSANWNGGLVMTPCLGDKNRMVNICHVWKGYVSFQYTAASGVSRDWFEDALCDVEKAVISGIYQGFYDITSERAKKSAAGAKGIFYFPYLRGGGGPHWNPDSRGAFVGLSMAHDKNDMAKAVLEGVAYNFRWMMESSREAGVPFGEGQPIRVIGGGARNEHWVQIYADVLGHSFEIVRDPHESTAKGGFLIAAVGLGWYRDYQEAAKNTVAIEKIICPDRQKTAIYDETFPVFKKTYHALETLFADVAAIQNKLV
jgi:xylulokinase